MYGISLGTNPSTCTQVKKSKSTSLLILSTFYFKFKSFNKFQDFIHQSCFSFIIFYLRLLRGSQFLFRLTLNFLGLKRVFLYTKQKFNLNTINLENLLEKTRKLPAT